MGIWRVTVLLISLSYQGKSEIIRCYCNLEECISNNSSCTNENGGCFSNFLDYRNITLAEHGCLHLLERERQEQCGNVPLSSSTSLLFCCKSDMCNQVLRPMPLWTHSIIDSLLNATGGQNNLIGGSGGIESRDHRTNEIWFKAATITVPICGAMILFLLIALAFKILRADHVNVDDYCGKAKSNANYADSHVISFKSSGLNSEELSKKMPLLHQESMRQCERSENFRNFASARIHFGQNVNILKERREDSTRNGMEKNLENAKINLEKPWLRNGGSRLDDEDDEEDESGKSNAQPRENNSNSMLDVRVEPEESSSVVALPVLCLNLDKPESLSSRNVYNGNSVSSNNGSKTFDQSAYLSGNVRDKVYDKYLL